MKLLYEYFDAQQKIYDYFGYNEDWTIPLSDCTEYQWFLTGEEHGGSVIYGENLTVENASLGDYYRAEIYTQRHLPKWVYRKEDYTMVCMDTNCDENKFLAIFDNSKEIKDEKVADAAKSFF